MQDMGSSSRRNLRGTTIQPCLDYQAYSSSEGGESIDTLKLPHISQGAYFWLFEGSPIPMVVSNKRGAVLMLNASARLFLASDVSTRPEELMLSWILSEDQSKFTAHLQSVSQNNNCSRAVVEVQLVGRKRSRTVVMTTESFGERLVTAIVDMTEIRESEKARIRTESQYAKLFSSSRDALLVVNSNSAVVLEANRAAAQLLSAATADTLAGQTLLSYLPTEQIDAWKAAVSRAMASKEAIPVFELDFLVGDQKERAEVRLSCVELEPPTLLVCLRDVEERRRLEAERLELESRIAQVDKMEALGTLAGGVAHDMNNMLTAVRVAASGLVEDLPPESAGRDDAQAILDACTRFSNLVENLLGFAKRDPHEKRVASLPRVIEEVFNLVSSRAKSCSVELLCDLRVDKPVVEADASRLIQSIMNLVLNALDEIPRDGTGKITVRVVPAQKVSKMIADKRGSFIRVDVEDNGKGMSPEVKSRAFDPFFTTKSEGKGTGLGLAVVYRNIRHAGGFTEIESELKKGTTVKLYLPEAKETGNYHRPSSMQTDNVISIPRVLLVEDEELVAKSVDRYLRKAGFNVRIARNGREGVDIFGNFKPSVVVLDVVMPEMDGPTCAKRLRSEQPNIPILFYSAHLREHAVDDLALDNQTQFLEKPFVFADLKSRLEKLIGRLHPEHCV